MSGEEELNVASDERRYREIWVGDSRQRPFRQVTHAAKQVYISPSAPPPDEIKDAHVISTVSDGLIHSNRIISLCAPRDWWP